MQFELANALSPLQNYINDVWKGFLDKFCTAYIEDILIFSQSHEDHHKHMNKVLKMLLDAGLQIDIKKCEFDLTLIKFLGLVITANGIKIDPSKLETIDNWPVPKTNKDLQRFNGFINFYRRFIRVF